MTLDEFRALVGVTPPDYPVSTRWRGILAQARAATAGMDVGGVAAFGAAGLFVPEGAYPETRYQREIWKALPGDHDTVVEVGPAYGALASLMKLERPSRRFVLVDLAEALPFCFAYLTRAFLDATVGVVTEHGGTRGDFTFCPAHLLHLLESPVDLFVNCTSLGEMTQAAVDRTMACVEDNLRPHAIYSYNQGFIDKNHHGDTGGTFGDGNLAAFHLSRPEWALQMCRLHLDHPEGTPRYLVSLALTRTDDLGDDVLLEGGDDHLGLMYLNALWSRPYVERFAAALDARRRADGFADPVEGVGEVRWLRGERG